MELREVMMLPCFSGSHVIAGEKGLFHTVHVVNVMEVPDIFNWVMEDELLLTTAYPYKDNPETLAVLIEQLHQKKIAGMAIKLHRFIEALPDSVLALANKLDFPLISLPAGAQFNRIIMETLTHIIENAAQNHKNEDNYASHLERIALSDGTLQSLVGEISRWCQGEVTVTSTAGAVLAHCRPEHFAVSASRGIFLEKPVILGGQLYAVVSLKLPEKSESTNGAAILNAAIPPLLMILLHDYVKEKDRTRDEHLQSLLLGQISLASLNAAPLDVVQPTDTYTICVLQPYNHKSGLDPQLFDIVNDALRALLPDSSDWPITTRMSKGIVHLCSSEYAHSEQELTKLYHSVLDALERRYPDLSISVGIGRFRQPAECINIGFAEAQRACLIGKKLFRKSGVFCYSDLAVESVLSHLEIDDEAERLIEMELGKLIRYDKKNNKQMLLTLEHLLSGTSNKVVAERMFIHPKTLAYRKAALEKILGASLSEPDKRFRLSLALTLYRLNRELWMDT